MTVLVRRFLDIARFPLEPRPPRDIFASMSPLPRHLPPPRLFALLPALAFAAATTLALARPAPSPPPTLQPDETASAFIKRWNEWAYATDPDQQLRKNLQAANDAAWNELRTVGERFNVYWPLDTITEPGHWTAAQMAAERIAPHTASIRELATRAYLAKPFQGPEGEAARRAELEAAWSDQQRMNREEPALPREWPPLPTNSLEMYFIASDLAPELFTAGSHLRKELRYALHLANFGLATRNLMAHIDLARLASERPGMTLAFSHELHVTSGISQLLSRDPRRLRDGALQTLQSALLEYWERRTPIVHASRFEERIYAELLPTWFDPDQPNRLSERGQAFASHIFPGPPHPVSMNTSQRFLFKSNASTDQAFAPANEQARIVQAIGEAFTSDTTTPWHSIEFLESERMFKRLAEADHDGRLTPALSRFIYYDALLQLEFSAEIQLRSTLTLLGIHRHRAITGAWPATLADIDPAVMRFEPVDPHSGQPFGYAVIDDQPTLWSAGPDRDNDDARPIPEPPALPEGELPRVPSLAWFTLNEWAALPPEVQAEHDGDILLFPPPTRD